MKNIVTELSLQDVMVRLIPMDSPVILKESPEIPMTIPIDMKTPVVFNIMCPQCGEEFLADDIIQTICDKGVGVTGLRCGDSPVKIKPPAGQRCRGFLKIEVDRLEYS